MVSVSIALPLKTMWGLYNAMQVLAYIRLYTIWPAPMQSGLLAVHNAISFEFAIEEMRESARGSFESEANESDE